MKKSLLIFPFACLTWFAQAQTPAGGSSPITNAASTAPKGNGSISGTILDAANQQPVAYATVTLLDPTSGKVLDGALCDDAGKFKIVKVGPGTYRVAVSFVGYETRNIDNVRVADRNSDVNLGAIKVNGSAQVLKEVTIEGQRALIEEKVDRTVYNAENDISNRGGDATDVLRKVPMLSVDMDGNVSIRGSQNLTVLINNRPSTITAGSIADALKQIPADMIKSVEVITSPSARYDAEGSGGIINIVTKKNTLRGGTLNLDTGAGLRGSNLGMRGSYRTGKMGFSLGGFGRSNYNTPGSFEMTQITPNGRTFQTADTRNNNIFGRYSFGWDYDINKKNFLSAGVNYGIRNGRTLQDDLSITRYQGDDITGKSVQNIRNKDNSGTIDVNLDYTHTFDKPQRELSVLTQFSRNNRNSDYLNYMTFNSQTVPNHTRNDNKSFNQENTVRIDYQTPIGKNQLIEVGGKEIIRNVTSNYTTLIATGNGPFVVDDKRSASNSFTYNQNIMAGYLAYTLTTKNNYSIKAGSRYEYTSINANFRSSDQGTIAIPSYGVLVPSVNVSKKLKAGNSVKLAYNRRIQRPSLQYLNPNRQFFNTTQFTEGNPNLSPEYTNNVELGYNTYIKSAAIYFTAFARNTNNSIQSIRQPLAGDTIRTTFDNIGLENAYGFSVFGSLDLSNKLRINGGTDVYYAVLNNNNPSSDLNAHNEGWVPSARLMGNYNLGQGWGLQGFGFYRGRQILLQGFQGGFGMYSLNIKKDLKNKKGSVGIGAENFFNTSIKIRSEITSPTLSQISVNERTNLNFRVNFSYSIGKMSMDAPRRRNKKSVGNDDLKQEGDNGGGMEGGQPQGGGAPAQAAPGGAPAPRPGGAAPAPQGPGARPGAGAPGARPAGGGGGSWGR
ncbi:TonB-dependent receptor [Adhaeribacter aquaticus]|uniref:TonB-dependent receptor n=1 Tax=Adhaeribacter aquaticus TaxID=299567 RepID=UPI00040BD31E|nr:TonB-dependent receptor [Adhaeribacter aquaticus]